MKHVICWIDLVKCWRNMKIIVALCLVNEYDLVIFVASLLWLILHFSPWCVMYKKWLSVYLVKKIFIWLLCLSGIDKSDSLTLIFCMNMSIEISIKYLWHQKYMIIERKARTRYSWICWKLKKTRVTCQFVMLWNSIYVYLIRSNWPCSIW